MSRYFDYWFPPAAPRPKAVKGKERKKFGTTWWGKAWIAIVEEEASYNRASRGRAYARADKVYDIRIGPGKATGKVEGSSGEEYKVEITCPVMPANDRGRVLQKVSDPSVAGPLLNNELPQGLEGFCSKNLLDDIDYDCSCPDYECPCKHIAALFYVLGDEIDHAPQILFALRGITNDDLLSALGSAPQAPTAAVSVLPAVHRRGRPPGSSNKGPDRPLGTARPPSGRRRGRPPGSKNKTRRGPQGKAGERTGRPRGRPRKATGAGSSRR